MSVLLVGLLFSSEGATFASPKKPLDVERWSITHVHQVIALEGIDYIDLEAFRAEMKPAWVGSNFG